MFLRLPVFGERQIVYPRGGGAVAEPVGALPLTFKVGEQIRITELDFKDSAIEFRLSSIDLTRRAVLVFSFGQSLSHTFPQRNSFEAALTATFTEGITYREIDQAKDQYIRDQFDRMVRQFAETTGSNPDAVLEAMIQAIPRYRELQQQLDEAERQNRALAASLKEEEAAKGKAVSELETLRRRASELERTGSLAQRERDELTSERDRLRRELQELQSANRRFQEQIGAVAAKLDVQVDSNAQLGRQVQSLSQNIDLLQRERAELSQKAVRLEERVAQLVRDRDRLASELATAVKENSRLQTDLRTLTSNRESLQATYLRTREARDRLEAARQLGEALALKWHNLQERDNGGIGGELYLLNQRLGSLELRPPARAGESASLTLRMESPDTVQFSEDERRLFDAMGRQLKIEAEWISWNGSFQARISEGDPVKAVAPRQEALWVWDFAGSPERPEVLSLQLRVLDENGLAVPLGEFQTTIGPSGWRGFLAEVSWTSLVTGAFLGSLVGGGLMVLTRRRAFSHRRQPRNYPAEKAL
jgi:seryl-tRNA synthetase